MAVTRINNNQISDAVAGNIYVGVNAASKLQDYSITAGKIANSLTYGSDLTISGNLTVNGQTTTIDTVSTVIEDPVIVLASNQTGSPAVDIGFIGERGSSDNIAFVWDESADEFVTAFTSDLVTNTTITISSYANFHTNDANIGGNLAVGGNISITGNVTSLNVTGNISGGNLLTPGVVTATGNITGGNLSAGSGIISTTGNVNGANVNATSGITAGTTVIATGNVSGGNVTTAGQVVAIGNVSGGNITTAGNVNGANVNATSGITAGTTVIATGNVTGGNLTTVGDVTTTTVTATGNVTGGNLTTAGITSTGSLTASTTINATGNITGGNLITTGITQTGTLTATANVNGGNIVSSTVTGGAGTLTINATGDVIFAQSGNINATSSWINNLADPAQAQDAATKQYVDDAVSSGITIHEPVRLESPTDIGGTYAQGGTTATVTDTVAGNTVVFSSAISPQVNDQYWFSNSFNGVVANTPYFVVSAPNTSAAVLSLTYSGVPVTTITSGSGLTQGVRINSGQGATLTNNGANATLVIDGVTVANTNRILVYQQANAVHNGVYVVTNAGNATSAWQLTRSSDMDTYAPDDINGLDAGDYFYVQEGDTGAGESYVMTAPIGPTIIGYANLTFTQFSASQVYSANTSAGLALNGTVFSAKVDNNTTAFDGGGNIIVKASANLTTPNIGAATGTSLNATGNVTGGNLTTGGQVVATGNINGTGAVFSGNVTAANFIGNISGNIDAGGANTNIQFNDGDILAGSAAFTFDKTSNAVIASGNITGGNINTAGQVVATGNVSGGNLVTIGLISAGTTITATGNVSGGNITTGAQVVATGNVTGGNINTGGRVVATGNIVSDFLVIGLGGRFGNLIVSENGITASANGIVNINQDQNDIDFAVRGNTVGNVFYVDAGTGTASFGTSTQTTNAIVAFNSPTSILMPVGNTQQRPGTGVTGMIRFNSTTNGLEVYDNTEWTAVGVPVFTVIDDQQFNGDGSTVAFTINSDQTTNSCIVSINGVVQIPTIAYSVSGTTLTFTEAPESGDIIDVRQITTTTTVVSISNTSGNAIVQVSDTNNDVNVTGDLVVSGSVSASSFIGLDASKISNGTSEMSVISSGGNIRANIAGTTVQTISPGLVAIVGDLSVTGNATLSGNILGDRIQNGTTQIDIQTPNGNANISVAGTSNVAVFTTTGLAVAGTVSVSGTGNVTGANIVATADVFTPEIIKTGSNAVGNIGQADNYFNRVFAQATSALYADLAEKYVADAEYVPGTVVVFGGDKEVTVTSTDADRAVAGVVSTNPSYIMNSGLEAEWVATVALTGRVPCRVTGTVRKGDLMVSAGYGLARAEADPRVGTVIGKALENHDGSEGVIEVVVGRF